jgi:hypothetical protein
MALAFLALGLFLTPQAKQIDGHYRGTLTAG